MRACCPRWLEPGVCASVPGAGAAAPQSAVRRRQTRRAQTPDPQSAAGPARHGWSVSFELRFAPTVFRLHLRVPTSVVEQCTHIQLPRNRLLGRNRSARFPPVPCGLLGTSWLAFGSVP
eukprot:7382642-Prymnesium_polylepis.1